MIDHDLLYQFVSTTITNKEFRKLFGADSSEFAGVLYCFEDHVGADGRTMEDLEKFAAYLPPDKQEMVRLFIAACYVSGEIGAGGEIRCAF